jgi:hypothetical protein
VNDGVLISAARRFLLVLLGVAGGTALISLALGALLGATAPRSISLGLYLVGSFLLVGGFLTGTRVRGDRVLLHGRGETRRAPDEGRYEAIELSSTFIAIGILLVMLGAVADQRVALF